MVTSAINMENYVFALSFSLQMLGFFGFVFFYKSQSKVNNSLTHFNIKSMFLFVFFFLSIRSCKGPQGKDVPNAKIKNYFPCLKSWTRGH